MTEPLYRLTDVVVAGKPASRLSIARLDIQPGITAVLGPSGAGKTTLLNLLVGFERPDRGAVSFGPPAGFSLPLFWVPQDAGLWPHMTVRQHLAAVKAGRSEQDGIEPILQALALSDRAESRPSRLSMGERTRTAIARALAADAAVLVMDEPLSHLDLRNARVCWDHIRYCLTSTGASLVYATHLPGLVLGDAEHVICLRDGEVRFQGSVEDLYPDPPSRDLMESLGEGNWFEPGEAAVWLPGYSPPAGEGTGFCVRPERLEAGPEPEGPLVAREVRPRGSVAEIEAEHPGSGARRRFWCRPVQASVRPGARLALRVLALLAAVMALHACARTREPALRVADVRYWSMPPDGARVPAPRAMATAAGGRLFVLDTAARVLVFRGDGTLDRSWRMPERASGNPEGILRLRDGRLAVADTHYHRVLFFDQAGAILGSLGRFGRGRGEFLYPVSLAEDPDGNLYVCEYGSNDRVQKFSPAGGIVSSFGGFGTTHGAFQRPSGILWHEGKLYVADAVNNRIQVFTSDGGFEGVLGGPGLLLKFPYDIALGPDRTLYAVEYGASRVTAVSLDGRLIGRFGVPGRGERQLDTPWGIACDERGRLYVADTGNRRIMVLTLEKG